MEGDKNSISKIHKGLFLRDAAHKGNDVICKVTEKKNGWLD